MFLLESKPENWDELVEKNNGQIYQTSHWAQVVEKGLGQKACYLVVDEGGKISAGALLFEKPLKLGFKQLSAYDEPFFSSEKALNKLLEFKSKGVLKLAGSVYWDKPEVFKKANFQPSERATFLIDLESREEEEIWMSFKKSARKCIKKAERLGGKVTEAKELDWEEYFKLIEETRKRINLESYPKSYYDELKNLADKGFAKLFVCKFGEEFAGGIVVLYFNGKMIESSVANATKFMNNYPSDLLKWHVIKWCLKNGIKSYDLGGVVPEPEPDSKHYNIYRFKAKWGGQFVKFNHYYKYPLQGLVNKDLFEKIREKGQFKIFKPWVDKEED